jgi:hypothetical protein
MPPINLDDQIFFNSTQPKIPNIRCQKPNILCEDAQGPQPHLATLSNDAILISSDNEPDQEDLASARASSSYRQLTSFLRIQARAKELIFIKSGGRQLEHAPVFCVSLFKGISRAEPSARHSR